MIWTVLKQFSPLGRPHGSGDAGPSPLSVLVANHPHPCPDTALDSQNFKQGLKALGRALLKAEAPQHTEALFDELVAAYEQADGTTTQYMLLWQLNTYYNQPFGHPDIKNRFWQTFWETLDSQSDTTLKAAMASHLIYGLKRQLLPNAVPALHFVSQGVYSTGQLELLVEELFWLYLNHQASPLLRGHLMSTLKALDKPSGDVVNYALQRFPLQNPSYNHAIIRLLGATRRYRIIKPLIAYCREYPDYARTIIRALGGQRFSDVDDFLLECLSSQCYHGDPLVILELVRQVRRRKLRRAAVHLQALFPFREYDLGIVAQSINHEVALTMADFGERSWAVQALLPELMMQGMTRQYLKAIKTFHLIEAVPLLKALLLMPDTPDLSVLQQEAFTICQSLLREAQKSGTSG